MTTVSGFSVVFAGEVPVVSGVVVDGAVTDEPMSVGAVVAAASCTAAGVAAAVAAAPPAHALFTERHVRPPALRPHRRERRRVQDVVDVCDIGSGARHWEWSGREGRVEDARAALAERQRTGMWSAAVRV